MPVTVIVGMFQLITFGWVVAIQSLLAVFLQSPIVVGGYAFSAERNALCKPPFRGSPEITKIN
jgi:hypothetical protein